MKLFTLLSILAAMVFPLVTVTSFGQEASKKEVLAGQLLDLLHPEKVLDGAFAVLPKMEKQLLDAQHLPPDQKEKVRQHVETTVDGMKKALTWESIRPLFVKIYAENFDEAELQGIIDYYKTPVGQKWLEKQPAVQNAKTQVMTEIILKIQTAAYEAAKHADEVAKPVPTAAP